MRGGCSSGSTARVPDPAPVHLSAEEREIVEAILRRHAPGVTVWAFGSRATGRLRPTSDLDLALEGRGPIGSAMLADLAEAFDASDLPWKVDLIDWATTSDTFRALIERERILLLPGSSRAVDA